MASLSTMSASPVSVPSWLLSEVIVLPAIEKWGSLSASDAGKTYVFFEIFISHFAPKLYRILGLIRMWSSQKQIQFFVHGVRKRSIGFWWSVGTGLSHLIERVFDTEPLWRFHGFKPLSLFSALGLLRSRLRHFEKQRLWLGSRYVGMTCCRLGVELASIPNDRKLSLTFRRTRLFPQLGNLKDIGTMLSNSSCSSNREWRAS